VANSERIALCSKDPGPGLSPSPLHPCFWVPKRDSFVVVDDEDELEALFADVVHSMDIAAAVGAERLREIMSELLDRSTAVVKRYGGTLSQFTGDGIMAVSGAPITLEDHAVRACLAALGIQEEAKRLATGVQDRDGTSTMSRCARSQALPASCNGC
jgi:class 3 adenylate cyclase